MPRIAFKVTSSMQAGEGAGRHDPGTCQGGHGCVSADTCGRREGSQHRCLAIAEQPIERLAVVRASLRQDAIGPIGLAPGASGLNPKLAEGGLLLDGDADARRFELKSFVRLAWLQRAERRPLRRVLGAMKRAWHPDLPVFRGERIDRGRATSWMSQVWFDTERGAAGEEMVALVRDRRGAGGWLSEIVADVLRTDCAAFASDVILAPVAIAERPEEQRVARLAEIRAPLRIERFVVGMNAGDLLESVTDDASLAALRAHFPFAKDRSLHEGFEQRRGRFRDRNASVVPMLRAAEDPVLPVSSLRGPLREAARFVAERWGLEGEDPTNALFGVVQGGARASRVSLAFAGAGSTLPLDRGAFELKPLYWGNALFKPQDFKPIRVLWYPRAECELVVQVRDATSVDLALVREALALLSAGFYRVGRFRSRGLGKITWTGKATALLVEDVRSWLGGAPARTIEWSPPEAAPELASRRQGARPGGEQRTGSRVEAVVAPLAPGPVEATASVTYTAGNGLVVAKTLIAGAQISAHGKLADIAGASDAALVDRLKKKKELANVRVVLAQLGPKDWRVQRLEP